MSKIIEFFKQKLSITAEDELPSQYIDKITLLQNSIVVPEVFTENIVEQFDAVLEEFGINIKAASFEEIKTSCNILKSFGFEISENNEDVLIEKLEFVTALSKWHGFSSISQISESKLSNLKTIYDAITGVELSNINYDVFNKVRKINLAPIKQLDKLGGEELHKFLEFCKSYGISTNIEISDLTKTSELNEILGILRIDNNWLEDANQKKLETLFKASDITKIGDIKPEYAKSLSVIKKELNFGFSKLSQLELKSYIKLLFSLDLTFTSTVEEIESVAWLGIFKMAFPLVAEEEKEEKEFEEKKLQHLFYVFDIDPKETKKLENLSSNLKKLNLDIRSLDVSEIIKIKWLLQYLDSNPTAEVITDNIKEKFIKIEEFLGADYHIRDMEKINKLARVVGKKKLSDLEVEEISILKLITKELCIDIKNTDISEIQEVVAILSTYGIKFAVKNQSTFSKTWRSEIKAFKDKLSHTKEIFKNFGYYSLTELKGHEIAKFKNILELYQKASFEDFTKDVSENINKFLNNLDLSFRELSSYKLQRITEGFKQIGINLFESMDHLEKYGYFLKEINLDLGKVNSLEGSEIKYTLKMMGVDGDITGEEVREIKCAIEKLHLPQFQEISFREINTLRILGDYIAGKKIELTPKVTCNIGKILHWYKIAFEPPLNTNAEYNRPNKIIMKVKNLQPFKIDLTSNEGVEAKNNLIMYLSILYKDKCHKDTDPRIDYEKELTSMMSLSSQKPDNFIAHADSRKECLKIKDATISEECKAFAKEIENEITQLCPIIHEDL